MDQNSTSDTLTEIDAKGNCVECGRPERHAAKTTRLPFAGGEEAVVCIEPPESSTNATFDTVENCIDFLHEQARKDFHADLGMDEFAFEIHYSPGYPEAKYRYIASASIVEREKWRPTRMLVGSGSGATVLEAAREACENSNEWTKNQEYRRAHE